MSIAGSNRTTGHIDPFLNKCIHGVEGVRTTDGKHFNPSCKVCVTELHYPHEVKEPA